MHSCTGLERQSFPGGELSHIIKCSLLNKACAIEFYWSCVYLDPHGSPKLPLRCNFLVNSVCTQTNHTFLGFRSKQYSIFAELESHEDLHWELASFEKAFKKFALTFHVGLIVLDRWGPFLDARHVFVWT